MMYDKSWGIEDAIFHMMLEVTNLDIEIEKTKNKLENLENKRNSLSIGKKILENLVEERKAKDKKVE